MNLVKKMTYFLLEKDNHNHVVQDYYLLVCHVSQKQIHFIQKTNTFTMK